MYEATGRQSCPPGFVISFKRTPSVVQRCQIQPERSFRVSSAVGTRRRSRNRLTRRRSRRRARPPPRRKTLRRARPAVGRVRGAGGGASGSSRGGRDNRSGPGLARPLPARGGVPGVPRGRRRRGRGSGGAVCRARARVPWERSAAAVGVKCCVPRVRACPVARSWRGRGAAAGTRVRGRDVRRRSRERETRVNRSPAHPRGLGTHSRLHRFGGVAQFVADRAARVVARRVVGERWSRSRVIFGVAASFGLRYPFELATRRLAGDLEGFGGSRTLGEALAERILRAPDRGLLAL